MIERGLSVDEVKRLLASEKPGLLMKWRQTACELIDRLFNGGRSCCMGCIEAAQQYRIRRLELETSLKRELIGKGFSVDEIEQILSEGKTGLGNSLIQQLEALGKKSVVACQTLCRIIQTQLQKVLPSSY